MSQTPMSAFAPPPYTSSLSTNVDLKDALISRTIQEEAARWSDELRELSLAIHDHPETAYKEIFAHSTLTTFLSKHGFDVEPSFVLSTAFRASFTWPPKDEQSSKPWSCLSTARPSGSKGKSRTIMLQSEYDALPNIGHACGHNLIAISGVLALLVLRKALIAHRLPGTIILLGTPAEEGGGGKIRLLDARAYEGVDACLMCHPGPGPRGWDEARGWGSVRPSLAIQTLNVEYHGKSAHAAGAPWEGINALDAVMLAYSSVSAARQQMHPADRVHGIVTNGGLAPNIIPDFASLKYFIRSPTLAGLKALRSQVEGCFQGAALATGAKCVVKAAPAHFDQRNNLPLSLAYQAVMRDLYGQDVPITSSSDGGADGGSFSTDFGNVTYAVPSLGSSYAIPTVSGGANHTRPFAAAARSKEAHASTVKAAVGLAVVASQILTDDGLARRVQDAFHSERGY